MEFSNWGNMVFLKRNFNWVNERELKENDTASYSRNKNHPCKEKNYTLGTVPETCVAVVQRSVGQSHWTHMECSSLKVRTSSSPELGRGRSTGHTVASWIQPERKNTNGRQSLKINNGGCMLFLQLKQAQAEKHSRGTAGTKEHQTPNW